MKKCIICGTLTSNTKYCSPNCAAVGRHLIYAMLRLREALNPVDRRKYSALKASRLRYYVKC
jgi:hypothetical protein